MSFPVEIDEASLIDFARRLVITPSLSQEERAVAELVAVEMERLEYDEVRVDPMGNVVGRLIGQPGGATLLFNGHLDHAGVGNMVEPFSGRIMDGTPFSYAGPVLYGRGASDMKGGLAAMVYGVAAARRHGAPRFGEILVTAVVREEMAQGEGIKYLLQQGGMRADFAVSGEATNLQTYVGHRGKAEFKITTFGRTSHAGYPAGGVNAVLHMHRLIDAILKGYHLPRHEVLGEATFTIIDIAASPGRLTPIVPDRCEIILDRRFFPEETPQGLMAELVALVDQLRLTDPSFKTEIELLKFFPALLTNPDSDIVRQALEARRQVLGDTGRIGTWYFGVDGTFLDKFGIPCVGFGPGNEYFAHTPEDHVPLDHLVKAAAVYAQMVINVGSNKKE